MHIKGDKLSEIQKLCKVHKVKTLHAFGSVTRDDFSEDSDIDLVVDIDENDPFRYTDLYFSLKEKIEKLLGRKVDLLESRALKNKFFLRHLEQTKVQLYG